MTTHRTVLVSACLLGRSCRYDGETARAECQDNVRPLLAADVEVIAFCPEEHGGLGTPRPPARMVGGDGHDVLDGRAAVVTDGGRDVTAGFVRGAQGALSCAETCGATAAVLKARSPSCGLGQTHTDQGLVAGDGVTAALLTRRGLLVINDEAFAAAPGRLLSPPRAGEGD